MAKRGLNGALTRAYGARDHQATVTGVEHLAPHFLRIRMTSETLLDDVVVAPTAWVRFWFPDPSDPNTEHQRAYTLTEVDEASGAFAVDVVLHEPAGPASTWSKRAVPGTTVAVTTLGSSRFDLPEDLPAGYLLLGDAASIPAINGILETVPPEVPIELYLEEHTPDDRSIPLAHHPRVTTHWVPRGGEATLAEAVEDRDWSNWYAWVAVESGSLKYLRTRLRDEFGFPKPDTHALAYWYVGRAFGKKRPKDLDETVHTQWPAAHDESAATADTASAPVANADRQPHSAPETEREPQPSRGSGSASTRGAWRSQAGGRLLAPLRGKLILAGVGSGFITLLQLAPFVLLVELARQLLSAAPAEQLWTTGVWAVVLMAAGTLLSILLMLWLHAVDATFAKELRGRLLTKLARVPLGWFSARSSGHAKQLVQDDTLALHSLVTHAVPDAVAAVVAPVAVLVYLFAVDWRIALLLLLPVLVYIVAMAIMVVSSGPRTALALRWGERMNAEAGAYLEGQPVIRMFGGAVSSRFRAQLSDYIAFLDGWQRPMTGQKTFIDLVTRPATFLLLICALGTTLIAADRMDPVEILPFLLLGTTFGARLLGVGYGLAGLRTGFMAARRIQIVLDEPELETESETEAASPSTATQPSMGLVEFDHVGFAYRPGVPVLEGVTLTLRPGTVTALVGPSGSGKSTLAALLARFHDVESGEIRVGGQKLRALTTDELYTRVGFVFQEVQLIRGTVRENIALAVPDATDERIEWAAREAQLHERIMRLPHGYDTMLGPDAALSGGERQRLTIARALLADTPVLILDEATAFADPESEYLVQRALNRLTAGRTVLVIAHRLHTIVGADQIVVLQQGQITEQGRHDELLAAQGEYAKLWTAATEHAVTVSGAER